MNGVCIDYVQDHVDFHWEDTPSPSCTGGEGRVSKQLTIKLTIKLIATSNNCTAQAVVATDMLHA